MSDDAGPDLRGLYSTAQLARIASVPASRVRAWVRHGLLRPVQVVKRLWFFDFNQIAGARALAELTKGGVTPRRVRAGLAALRAWVPDEGALLTHLEALERGGPLVVRTHEGALAEPTGQLRIDFDGGADAGPEAPPAPSSETWFARGVLAEDAGALDVAEEAYLRALALGGPDAEVAFNLGNVLYALDRPLDAAARFREAVALEPDYVEAWNNLGNALASAEEPDEALAAYRAALEMQPAYADAHFNLAEALAARGDRAGAERHWRAYLTLDPASPWADEVRTRLEGQLT